MFTDYGPEYAALTNAGLEDGFFLSYQTVSTDNGSALLVFYSDDLEQTQADILSVAVQSLNRYLPFSVVGIVILLIPRVISTLLGGLWLQSSLELVFPPTLFAYFCGYASGDFQRYTQRHAED